MYSANFGTSLIAVALVTTFVMLAVTSNVVLSLGMVGALSIVRFRTAVKDPMDIAFLFWSLAAGIVLASGLVHLAVLGSLFIGIVMLVFSDRRGRGAPVHPRRPLRGRDGGARGARLRRLARQGAFAQEQERFARARRAELRGAPV